MDILVRISTDIDKPSDRIAAGWVATLNAIFEVVNKWVVFGALEPKYGQTNADWLSGLVPLLGEVQSVKFVPAEDTEPAAAGGDEKPKIIILYRGTEAFGRAEGIICFRAHPPAPFVTSNWIKLCPETNTLICWIRPPNGPEVPYSDVIDKESALYIFQALEEEGRLF